MNNQNKKTVLIYTLGNRDAQFELKKGVAIDVDIKDNCLVEREPDPYEQAHYQDSKFYTIKHNHKDKQYTFRKNTEAILEEIGLSGQRFDFEKYWYGRLVERKALELLDTLRFPMLQKCIERITTNGDTLLEIILVPTNQPQIYGKDTIYVAHLAKAFLMKNSNILASHVDIKLHDINHNPTDFDKNLPFCDQQITALEQRGFNNIFICSTSGVPMVSNAYQMIGVLAEHIHYLEVNSNTGTAKRLNMTQRNQILLKRFLHHIEQKF